MLIPLDRRRPITDQIYLFLREAVLRGERAPGERLPPTRRLAETLGVARNTVVAAYERLRAEGYVVGRGAAGTRVAADLPHPRFERRRPAPRKGQQHSAPLSRYAQRASANRDIYPPAVRMDRSSLRWDFDYNVNVADATSRKAWYRTLRRCSTRHENQTVPYDFREGPGHLQRALVRYLRLTRGVVCHPEQVLLTHGFQHAFQLTTRVLLEPGDTAALEDPHRLGFRNALRAHGARVIPLPSDEEGLRVDLLIGRNPPARLLYTNASFQWPTGAVLPLSRRMALLEWARRKRCWILEGDHNGEYLYRGTPVQSLQRLDGGERVIYFGTFSRLVSPDPEIGYMVVPESLVQPFDAARSLEGYAVALLQDEAMARFLESGDMEGLLRRTTRRMRERRHILVEALRALPGDPFRVRESAGGLHVHALLPRLAVRNLPRFVERAAEAGVGVFPDLPYFMRPPETPGIILGFAALTAEEIREGVAHLGQVIDGMPAS